MNNTTNWHNVKMQLFIVLSFIVAVLTALKGVNGISEITAVALPILIALEHAIGGNTGTDSQS